jgi:hypothetical protein
MLAGKLEKEEEPTTTSEPTTSEPTTMPPITTMLPEPIPTTTSPEMDNNSWKEYSWDSFFE